MDLLKLIRENSEALTGTGFETGLAAVIRHVERAEKYLLVGRDEGDHDFFNDVIYRTNQAYERNSQGGLRAVSRERRYRA